MSSPRGGRFGCQGQGESPTIGHGGDHRARRRPAERATVSSRSAVGLNEQIPALARSSQRGRLWRAPTAPSQDALQTKPTRCPPVAQLLVTRRCTVVSSVTPARTRTHKNKQIARNRRLFCGVGSNPLAPTIVEARCARPGLEASAAPVLRPLRGLRTGAEQILLPRLLSVGPRAHDSSRRGVVLVAKYHRHPESTPPASRVDSARVQSRLRLHPESTLPHARARHRGE